MFQRKISWIQLAISDISGVVSKVRTFCWSLLQSSINIPCCGIATITASSLAVKRTCVGVADNSILIALFNTAVVFGFASSNACLSNSVFPNKSPAVSLPLLTIYLPFGHPQAKHPVRFPIVNKFPEAGNVSSSSNPGSNICNRTSRFNALNCKSCHSAPPRKLEGTYISLQLVFCFFYCRGVRCIERLEGILVLVEEGSFGCAFYGWRSQLRPLRGHFHVVCFARSELKIDAQRLTKKSSCKGYTLESWKTSFQR